MVFQEPMTSLNPSMTINKQLTEVLVEHLAIGKKEARERSSDMLAQMGIPDAARRMDDYPHQLSGGMRQRVMVAMAMLCYPRLIIADEATTALDATIQAQLLELLYATVKKNRTALVLVTHNLGVVARYADRIYVMYAGRIVEAGTPEEVWAKPLHPYTEGLLRCVPRLGEKLIPIKGMPPSLIERPATCSYVPRCNCYAEECLGAPLMELTHVEGHHYTTCPLRLEAR